MEATGIRCAQMRKSRLETYEDILEILVSKPSTVDHMAYEIGLDCTVLRERLDFLLQNSLVEERALGRREGYAITERGIAVLKALNFQKYLEKVTDKLMVMDEALQIVSRHDRDLEKTEG
jgi:predicted transcriptional regulator